MAAMEEDGGQLQVVLRQYQQEMLDASLAGNKIVVMPTGSGKTHVAIARMRIELEKSAPDKLVWFLANSVELSQQHYATFQQHLEAYQILSLTGADGVDNWSEQRLWDAVLTNVRVVVGTPAVLKDALTHGFVPISRLTLLVFDEAHHCIKNHPMNVIMKSFYHPSKSRGEPVPHVLGLTASPSINPKEGSLAQLEANLDAAVATPKRSLDELMRYVWPPHVTPVTYATNACEYPGDSRLCAALRSAAEQYNFANDPEVLELLQYDDERSRRKCEKGKTRCSEEIRTLDRRAATLYEQLGHDAAENYVRKCISRLQLAESVFASAMLPDSSMQQRHHLCRVLDSVVQSQSGRHRDHESHEHLSPKLGRLISLLAQQARPEQSCIIFARERVTVVELSDLLSTSQYLTSDYKVGGFVGTSSFDGKSTFADLADPRTQKQDLADFRSGAKNLIVATSVLEEGIDVSACNLVINFDPPDTLIAFLQRRGRARKVDSKYFLLLSEENGKIDPQKWQAQEAKMKSEYSDAERERTVAEAQDEEALDTKFYRIENTKAMITLNDAKAHLHHFCSVSMSTANKYIDPKPEFSATHDENDGDGKLWSATVTLPSSIHADVRVASSSRQWRSESAAIKDAAFEAYVALHKAALLTDNLLPFKQEGPEFGQEHVDQPSIIQVRERASSWALLAGHLSTSATTWHACKLSITSPWGDEEVASARVLLPAPVPHADAFPLHWNERTKYSAAISASTVVRVGHDELHRLRQQTFTLLQCVHASRMASAEQVDFLYLLHLTQKFTAGATPAKQHFANMDEEVCRGQIVRLESKPGRLYVLNGLDKGDTCQSLDAANLVVTRFPKRKDFLHPVPERQMINMAYTTEERYPISECAIDNIPFEQTMLSAFVPSILYRLDVQLLVHDLQWTVLKEVQITNSSLLKEAISSPSAGEKADYNRLEFLGDAVLKFCAALQVTAQHPTWPESYLTLEKFRLVRNSTLCQSALKLGLDKYILVKPFTGAKWRPPYGSDYGTANSEKSREMSSKTVADVVEALIGAALVDGGLAKAQACLKTLLPDETWLDQAAIFTSLTENLCPITHSSLDVLEQLIGHHFKEPTLLIEAITHASLPFQRTGMSYERLEFLGDAVLDLLIVPKLHAHPRRLKHYEMHSIHEALVNGLFLGFCCMQYSVEEQQNHIIKKDGTYDVQQGSRRLHLHDFIRASGQLLRARQASLDAFEKYRESVEEALNAGEVYPWSDLLAMSPQKFFSDLVESVLGALYIDTHGDLGVCEVFIERLGIVKYMQIMVDNETETMSPKERLGILAGGETVEYSVRTDKLGDAPAISCSVKIAGKAVATVSGCGNRAEAEARAAEVAGARLRSPSRKRKLDSQIETTAGCEAESSDADTEDADVGPGGGGVRLTV